METTNKKKVIRGVYFISNDTVLELTIAFLNSFRMHNPSIPLCLIPYNSGYLTVEALKEQYNFEIFPEDALLKECDKISYRFHGNDNGSYRKLAMWDGPFDEFIYIDVDTVVLENVLFAFKFLDNYDFITSHSDCPEIRRFVWKDSILHSRVLTRTQVQFSANTGFITSKKGAINFEQISGKLEAALQIRSHMELQCQEQPFLNYCIVTANKNYSSLLTLANTKPGIMLEAWAGTKGGKIKNGKIRFKDENFPVFLLHWAGLWRQKSMYSIVFASLRIFSYHSSSGYLTIPYKKIWLYYRYREYNALTTLIK